VIELADIKADLPNWPDEIITEWPLKIANRGPDTGWPPPEPLAPCERCNIAMTSACFDFLRDALVAFLAFFFSLFFPVEADRPEVFGADAPMLAMVSSLSACLAL
jgi:hypothetical protein